ncbi:MAG: hypothetical protein ACRD0P_09510 [Stackebrandtia sp.]
MATAEMMRRIERDAALAHGLDAHCDFDVERRDPIEPDLVIPNGMPLRPIAGSSGGGTYFLCGETGPVLYADSEGRASLLGEDLREVLIVLVVLPFWKDLAVRRDLSWAAEWFGEDRPGFEAERDRLLLILGLGEVSPQEAEQMLYAAAVRTEPDFLPRVPDENHMPYDPMFD